jgi:hypothetical protein
MEPRCAENDTLSEKSHGQGVQFDGHVSVLLYELPLPGVYL